MRVDLADSDHLSLSFRYHAPTVAWVKALPGAAWDGELRLWTAPLHLLRKIVDQFPDAKVDRAAVDARLAMWRRWVQQHNACGIWFAYDHDLMTVVPVGEGVSPVFVEHVASLSAVLAQFLGDQVERTEAKPVTLPTVEPTRGDRLIWEGIQNAAKKAERDEERKPRRKWSGARQMALIEE